MNAVSLTSLLLAFITSGAPVAGSDAFPINISFLTVGPDENAENAYHACADIIAAIRETCNDAANFDDPSALEIFEGCVEKCRGDFSEAGSIIFPDQCPEWKDASCCYRQCDVSTISSAAAACFKAVDKMHFCILEFECSTDPECDDPTFKLKGAASGFKTKS
mmetsp:Transcript_12678/g.30939  ORF Transcript_12678/g.30939 Transcript_12678/m.30939 type:complete len:163 (-) Transcript_12678:189-677(-)|eukprot:CAMPEP_0181120924 /NCGR_PEP_ID=MMETSP1071-20121207/24441_1 /TAXON_ID=35127 /ORGANISM="Thalassiosira sp., Strain NH16" /LENGTH=162 /DNA_ID=CAMNT_0023205663 /DNA_START=42 /DNA_END=530 /DNA_ORIENTATION=-